MTDSGALRSRLAEAADRWAMTFRANEAAFREVAATVTEAHEQQALTGETLEALTDLRTGMPGMLHTILAGGNGSQPWDDTGEAPAGWSDAKLAAEALAAPSDPVLAAECAERWPQLAGYGMAVLDAWRACQDNPAAASALDVLRARWRRRYQAIAGGAPEAAFVPNASTQQRIAGNPASA